MLKIGDIAPLNTNVWKTENNSQLSLKLRNMIQNSYLAKLMFDTEINKNLFFFSLPFSLPFLHMSMPMMENCEKSV